MNETRLDLACWKIRLGWATDRKNELHTTIILARWVSNRSFLMCALRIKLKVAASPVDSCQILIIIALVDSVHSDFESKFVLKYFRLAFLFFGAPLGFNSPILLLGEEFKVAKLQCLYGTRSRAVNFDV